MDWLKLLIAFLAGFIMGDASGIFSGFYLNRHYYKEGFAAGDGDGDTNPMDLDYFISRPVSLKPYAFRNLIMGLVIGALWSVLYLTGSDIISVILYMLASLLLLILSLVDWAVYEIPPVFVAAIACLGLVRLLTDLASWPLYLIGAVTVSGIFLLAMLITKGRGMGGGDVKLMAALGLLLGWKLILLCMILGCFLGALIHSIRKAVLKSEPYLAFGPYLSMGAAICMCYGTAIVDWYFRYFSATVYY